MPKSETFDEIQARKKVEAEQKVQREYERKQKEEQDVLNSMTDADREQAIKSKDAEAIKLKGNEEFKKKNFEEALALYKQANEMNPSELTYYLNLAGCYHELKNYKASIESCEHVVANTNDFIKKGKAFGRMAFAYEALEEMEKAIECFEKSLLESSDKTIKEYHKKAIEKKKN